MTQRNRFFIPREDKRLGHSYQLLECLGDGSYGWVWRAEKLATHAIVALKIPKEQGASNDDLAEGVRADASSIASQRRQCVLDGTRPA